ncbi:MAG TPA: hypothetical protein PLJ38_06165, partial [bacterium]|nr:hypothetical protein [bacterium]
MPNMILDNFSELLLAIKEDEILKKKLIDICKLPAQQRIVEAEKLSFENKQLTLASVMHLLKNDLIANEIVKYLTETDKKTEKKFLDIIKEKPLIFIIPLIAIVIILAVMVVVKSGGKTNHPTGAMTIEVNNKLVLPTNYQSSPLVEYQKIMNEKDEQSVILKIEKFFEKFPNSDYTEDLKVKYLTLLFKTNQTDKIPIFLEKNMDYNQRY